MVKKKSDNIQDIGEYPAYIVLRYGYNDKIILPFLDGIEFIKARAKGFELITEYQKADILKRMRGNLEVNFMSQQEFAELHIDMLLEGES